MSDTLPTVWEAEPHTLAKHGILKSYLDAWAAILSNQPYGAELLFVDGFAGPGEYVKGEPGSPLVALNSILDHSRTLPKKIRFKFIELDQKRHAHLVARLAQDNGRIASNERVVVDPPIRGDCEVEIGRLIAERKQRRQTLGPALFFLDQFGYSQVPMSLVCAIMAEQQCEIFSYLNCQRMNTYLGDQTKWVGITQAYGDESWKPAINMTGDARQEFLISTYMSAIRKYAKTNNVWSFAMFDSGGHLIHWLVFATNHWKGLYEMKKAMWSADKKGEYRYSDRVEGIGQQSFLSMLGDDELAEELANELAGQTLSEQQVSDFVLTNTPFYNFKDQVNRLRASNRAAPRKRGQWPVTFASK
ncbi:MAG: three-Cys-motif partner protein TcmP [Vicinamibacterales bacterium]